MRVCWDVEYLAFCMRNFGFLMIGCLGFGMLACETVELLELETWNLECWDAGLLNF